MKDLSVLRYFLGLKVAYIYQGIVLCEGKYALGLLEELKMSGRKPFRLPLNPSLKVDAYIRTTLEGPNK